MRAQLHLRQVLAASDLLVLNKPEVCVARAWEKFDQTGELTDEQSRQQVRGQAATLELTGR